MRYGTAADRIFTLPHFTDFEHFASGSQSALPHRETIRAGLGLSGVTFAYVGRLWTGKGLDYLLDAFAGLVRRHGRNVSLLLAGDGPDEGRLRRRCEEEGLLNVVFAGFHQRDELPRIYMAADVFVFPTVGDPYGHVVEEAMSCGLPVISTSAAGEIGDRVREGQNGFIVPPADSAALLARMEVLTSDSHLRKRLARTAAETVAGKTSNRWAEEFERVVAEVLSLPPAGSSPV
jgi:glycosyltransferase involved in cell wall biosynthesis